MNYLTIDEVSAFAMTTCKGATPEDRHLFRNWIVAAVRDIGCSKDWYKTDTLYVKDFCMTKPPDLVATCGLALYDSSDNELLYNYNPGSKRIHTNRFLVNSVDSTSYVASTIDLSEDAHYFHLSSNSTATYALIRYFAMPTDDQGFPLIPEDHLLAHEAFCRYMYAKRMDDNRSKIDQDYNIWLKERDKAKGKSKMPSMLEAQGMFSRYLSLVGTPIYRTF